MMRSYPIDSSKAQARIIVAALLADGGLDLSELEMLEDRSILDHLNMSADEFNTVLHDFCNDANLYSLRHESGELRLGDESVAPMLAEIRNKATRLWLLGTIYELVHVDQAVSPVEAQLVSAMTSRWEISLRDLQTTRRAGAGCWPPQVRRAAAEACS
jgi:hypothetical protein